MIYDYKTPIFALIASVFLLACSQPDNCIDGKDCISNSQSVSEVTTKPKIKSDDTAVKTSESISQTSSFEKQAVTETIATEPVYKQAFSIMNFSEETENSDGFEEVISDMGFYLLEAEDELKKSDIEFVKGIDDIEKLPITVDGKTLKTINAKTLMKEDCCGFIVVQNGKPAEFIPLVPGETARLIQGYFEIE